MDHQIEEQQAAQLIILSCYSIETPRLLLNSAQAGFPDGLANSSGLVGKALMVHPAQHRLRPLPGAGVSI